MPSTTFLPQDLKLALRAARRTPGSTAAAVLVIALGVGVNLALWALAQAVLLQPLPYPDADRLAILSLAVRDGADFGVAREEVRTWQTQLTAAEAVAAYDTTDSTLRGVGEPRRLRVARVTPELFDLLGVPAERGTTEAGADGLVLSARLARQLGATLNTEEATDVEDTKDDGAHLLGTGVRLGDRLHTVRGVMPAAFAFPSERIDAWVPVAQPEDLAQAAAGQERSNTSPARLLARFPEGLSTAQIDVAMQRTVDEVWRLRGQEPLGVQTLVTRIDEAVLGDARPVLLASWVAALLVLLVTCGNVALLQLGRAIERRPEMAVRRALGASRWRLARSPLVESLTLATLGSVLGLWLAHLALGGVARWGLGFLPRLAELNPSVLLTTSLPGLALMVGAVLTVALLTGAVPAWSQHRAAMGGDDLGLRSRTEGGQRTHRLVAGVVVAQIAASVVLLAGATLLARTVDRLMTQDLGFDPDGVLTVPLFAREDTGADPDLSAQRQRWVADLLERVRALPGVEAAGVGSSLPPVDPPFQIFVQVVDGDAVVSQRMSVVSATAGYLEALGMRLEAGRLFDASDTSTERPVLVVSATSARFYTPNPDRPLVGRGLGIPLPPVARFDTPPEVVGIVSDLRFAGLDQPAAAALFVPWHARPVAAAHLAIRAPGASPALAGQIRALLRELDPGMPVATVEPLATTMARSIQDRRARRIPAVGFATLALLVALTGLYAVLTRAVAERRRELAIRRALGATRGRVAAGLLRRASVLLVAGLSLGLFGAVAVGRGLRALLYGVEPTDPSTLIGVALTVLVAGLLVAWRPAAHAAATAPAEILRGE